MKQVLQWWYGKQSKRLSREAGNIRNGLLQDSFAVRRSIELSVFKRDEVSQQTCLDWLKKFENFHHSLKNLSDRLSPPFLEESFPLAIQYLLQLWQTNNQVIDLDLHLPKQWHYQPIEFSRLMLSILDELLNIALAKIVKKTSVRVSLREQTSINKLRVQIIYSDRATLVDTSNSQELRYLQQSFQMLTLGQCFSERKELSVTWYFLWQ